MKWISSITLFSLLALSLRTFTGCAAPPEKKDMPVHSADAPQDKSDKDPSEMKISYSNKSSKVSMVLDINSQDLNLVMSGSPPGPPSAPNKFPWLDKNQAQQYTDSADAPNNKDKGGEDNEDWDDVMDIAKGNDLTKGDVQQVLAEIRKAQEFFYQKRYPEALDMVKFSIQKQETAEGFALMGSTLYMMGDMKAAKESWIQSLRLNPDMPAVIQMLNKLKKAEPKKAKQ